MQDPTQNYHTTSIYLFTYCILSYSLQWKSMWNWPSGCLWNIAVSKQWNVPWWCGWLYVFLQQLWRGVLCRGPVPAQHRDLQCCRTGVLQWRHLCPHGHIPQILRMRWWLYGVTVWGRNWWELFLYGLIQNCCSSECSLGNYVDIS